MKTKFKKGMTVIKIFHGLDGYTERANAIIGKVTKNAIYLNDGEGNLEEGITYDHNGREIENFFSPMWSEIKEESK